MAADTSPREIELKFELEPESAEPIGRLLSLWSRERAGRPEDLHSVYYDTDAHDLRVEGFSLRLRKERGRWMQTAKSGEAGSFSRGEWEAEAPGGMLHLGALAGTPIEELLEFGELKPQFEVRVKRTRRRIRSDGQDVEASLDSGEVVAAGKHSRVCELELELKGGEPKGLFSLARTLSENEPLNLSFTSKAERGYALLDDAEAEAIHANKGVVRRGSTVAQAFQQIGRECLSQLSANASLLRRIRRPDVVHQARVGVRRFRAALSLFKDVVADERFEQVKTELKWLAGELGDARNLDVFVQTAFRPAAGRDHEVPGMAALGDVLLARQDTAYNRALEAIGSRRYRDLVLDTAEWIETGAWMSPNGETARAALAGPVEAFAKASLRKRIKAVRKKGRDLGGLDDHGRHELRIAGKKLRYAVEFFEGLAKGKAKDRLARLLKALKPLQEVLGQLNDVATGATLTADLARVGDGQSETAYAAGVIAGRRNADAAALGGELDKAWGRFEKARPIW